MEWFFDLICDLNWVDPVKLTTDFVACDQYNI